MINVVNLLSDEAKLEIVREYMYTGISQTKLMAKYNFSWISNLYHWIVKFGFMDEYMSQKMLTRDFSINSFAVNKFQDKSKVDREVQNNYLKIEIEFN